MKSVTLFASGDLRESANTTCWPAQKAMKTSLKREFLALEVEVVRGHPFKMDKGHGFLASQREGMDAFANIDPQAPIVVAEAVWQYSHHVLAGLISHQGPILTVANWSGQWPGLVGMLNLNGSLTKAGVAYSTIWSGDFTDGFFRDKLRHWVNSGTISHDTSHVTPFDFDAAPAPAQVIAQIIVEDLKTRKSIMGVFDEGCMGMYNAIIPDELLFPLSVYKERLSQSALYHATRQVPESEAQAVYDWLMAKGMTFHLGDDPAQDLTLVQVLDQCRMHIATLRIADEFGCESIGIQYQQGLKDLLPASDLVEGMLNNSDRPPVTRADGSVINLGKPMIHFNEVDECAGLDALLISRVHQALGQPVETTLHDIRWGDSVLTDEGDNFVWVFEISGAAPPAHHGGWQNSESYRQPAMYFPAGGGTLKGIAKPGHIIWPRIYVMDGELNFDIGLGEVVELPQDEITRRSEGTTREWPMMNAVLSGVSRDQMMARHKSNHVQVVYAHSSDEAQEALNPRAALAQCLGIRTYICM